MIKWENLPDRLKVDAVRPYYKFLQKQRIQLGIKRVLDVIFGVILFILLLPIFLIIAMYIKFDSQGPVFFRQERVTTYGKIFYIFKFRTMINGAENKGTSVTAKNDCRVTGAGRFLRKYRLDELPQLLNIIIGEMSFVGTRPEVKKYTDQYSDEMLATLLLPAGVTSMASIMYKDEDALLDAAEDIDYVYVTKVLPEKMKYNLEYLKNVSIVEDIKIIMHTVFKVLVRV